MATNSPLLLPIPRSITVNDQAKSLALDGLILASPALFFEARKAQKALAAINVNWTISAYCHDPALTMQIDMTVEHAQGYILTIDDNGITIRGADAAGVFYGTCTLTQLLTQYGRNLPYMVIEDWPDFPARGVMLDVSRDKVPTMQTLYELIDRLASWKVNQLQLYMEHTFAYQDHRQVWSQASPFTGQQIMELDAYCKQRHVDLVPNQNSLGHFERWLKFDRYNHLSEKPDGFEFDGGHHLPSTLDPQDPGSIALIESLYDELLPHFSSSTFNIGGDEPWELGKGKSKQAVEEQGGRIYLNWLLKLHKLVTDRNYQMQFWGDIIIKYPDLVPELPKDTIVMEWGYESSHPFDEHCALFAKSGLSFYVCPGTSSWNTLVGRTDNAIGNLHAAAKAGLKHGAIGFLNTDWGDRGHWQPLSVSYLGFAVGAAVSWAYEANQSLDIPAALSAYAFEDEAGIMGQVAYDLGNVYHIVGPDHINGQNLAYILLESFDTIPYRLEQNNRWGKAETNISPDNLNKAIKQIDEIIHKLNETRMHHEHSPIIKSEYGQAANLLKHGARYLLCYQNASDMAVDELLFELDTLIPQQRATWLLRNRRGGLEDSIRRFDPIRNQYLQLIRATDS